MRALRLVPVLLAALAIVALYRGMHPGAAAASSIPAVPATANHPADDVPTLYALELSQIPDLSGATVEVKSFGALGDGSTNDTTSVQNALNSSNGKTLHFPSGTYLIDSVNPPASVRILGDGAGLTILKHRSGSTTGMVITTSTATNIQVANLTIDGNYAGVGDRHVAGFEISSARTWFDHIEGVNGTQEVIRLRETTATAIVSNSYLHDSQLHGAALGDDTRFIQVDHELSNDGDVWFKNNTLEMVTPPATGGHCSGANCSSVGGIRSSGDTNTRVFWWGNTFRNLGQDWDDGTGNLEITAVTDIYRNGDGSVVWQNQYFNSYFTPIRTMRSNNVQIVDNIINGEGQIGPSFGGGIDHQGRTPRVNMSGLTIRGNTLSNLPDSQAITGFFDPDGTMSGIVIDQNTADHTGGFVFESYVAGSVTISNNTATNQTGAFTAFANSTGATQTICGNSWAGGNGACAGTPTPTPTAAATSTPTPVPPTFTPTPGATSTPTPTAVAATCPCTILGSRVPVTYSENNGGIMNLGIKFQSDIAGSIYGIRYWKETTDTGSHVGDLWSSTGTKLASGTFANESASGWQTLTFASPVAITANTTYVASRTDALGNFVVTPHGLDNALTSGHLTALSGTVSGNGVLSWGTGGTGELFPTITDSQHSIYFTDVLFNTAAPTPTPTATALPIATSTPTVMPTSTPTPTTPGELAVAFGEGGTDTGTWTATAGWTLDVNYAGSPGARPEAIAHKSVTAHTAVTGPTLTNAGSQSASGGSLVLLRGSNLSFHGATAGIHISGVAGGSSVTFATPASTANGDIVFVYVDTTTAQTITPPTGWTKARADGEGTAWYQIFATAPANLGSWSTTGGSGWDHVQASFGGVPVVDAVGGGGAQTSSAVSTGSATSP